MGESTPKQYLAVAGLPMLRHSLAALAAVARVDRVIAILAPDDAHWNAHDWSALAGRVEALRAGGQTRARSVANALERLAGEAAPDDWILVHDAARPCLTPAMVERLLDEAGESQAVESLGHRPRLVQGDNANFKVTFPEDLALAETILTHRRKHA